MIALKTPYTALIPAIINKAYEAGITPDKVPRMLAPLTIMVKINSVV
jgi:hypothetical protein